METNWIQRIFTIDLPWNRKKAKPAGEKLGIQQGPRGAVSTRINPNTESKTFGDTVEQMNADYQIAFANSIITANAAAVPVSISVENSDGAKSDELQKKIQTLWESSIRSMTKSVGFGRVAYEKDWDYCTDAQVTYIKKLEPMEFRDSRLKLKDDHSYGGFEVRIDTNPDKWEKVNVHDSWWLALDATAKNPHGQSRYRGAVETIWRIKAENVRNLNMFAKRFAIRGGVAHGPMTEVDERTGNEYSVVERMTEAANALWTGGMMYLPNTKHPDPDMVGKYAYDFEEADPHMLDPAPLLNVIDKNDVAILRAFGIPEKAAIEGDGGGSYAMLSQQMLTLFALIDALMSQFVESFQKYVINPMRDANYEGPGPKFKINFTKLSNRPDSFVITLLTALAANPSFAEVILSGGVDLRNMLESVGLPVSAELEEVAKSVAARMKATADAASGGAKPFGGPDGGDGMTMDDSAGGEFGSTSRLQWTRNVKAIRDVLSDLTAGKSSPAFAQTMLESLGLSPARAKALIDDASDGTVDDPELNAAAAGGVTMANEIRGKSRRYWQSLLAGDAAADLICPGVNVLTFHCGTGAGGFQAGNHCWKQTHHLSKEEHRAKAKKMGITSNVQADRIHSHRVEAAVNRGHFVPDHVLAQYPKHENKRRERVEIANAAKRHGVKFHEIEQQIPDSYAQLKSEHELREAGKESARKMMGGITSRTINQWEDAGKDYSHPSIKRWDEGSQEVALRHPELQIDPHDGSASRAVWDLIKEGARPAPKPRGADVLEHAGQYVAHAKATGKKRRPVIHDENNGFGDAFEGDDHGFSGFDDHVSGVPFQNRLTEVVRAAVAESKSEGVIEQQRAIFKNFLRRLDEKKKIPADVMTRAIDAIGSNGAGLTFKNALVVLADHLNEQGEDPPIRPVDLKGAPAVPRWKVLADQAVIEAEKLFDQMEAAIEAGATLAEIDAIRKQIEQLGNEVRTAGVILGLLAPWKPKKRKNRLIAFGAWDESKHPREGGKFAAKIVANPIKVDPGSFGTYADGSKVKFDSQMNAIEGDIDGIPISTESRSLIGKISKRTKAGIEAAFSDPETRAAIDAAGIHTVHLAEASVPYRPKGWTMAHSDGRLMINPQTGDRLAKHEEIRQKNAKHLGVTRPERGFIGVIHHEAGHALFKKAKPETRAGFVDALKSHPEVVKDIAREQGIEAPSTQFNDGANDKNDYRIGEVHAELNAIRHYDRPRFAGFPEKIRSAVNAFHPKPAVPEVAAGEVKADDPPAWGLRKPPIKKTQATLFGPGGETSSKTVKWRFPWIQKAIDFLIAKEVVPASFFPSLNMDEQQAAFTAPGIEDKDTLKGIRDEIAAGQTLGESLAEFRKRIGNSLALTRAQTETTFRTNVHQGFVSGFDQGVASEAVTEAFPAVMFSATHDNRVRETHWELDGFVCLRSDPAYKVLLRALKDWNCRCNPIPMTLKAAEREGLKTIKDLPADIMKKYGQGI